MVDRVDDGPYREEGERWRRLCRGPGNGLARRPFAAHAMRTSTPQRAATCCAS